MLGDDIGMAHRADAAMLMIAFGCMPEVFSKGSHSPHGAFHFEVL